MFLIVVLWFIFCFLSFGVLGFIFVSMKKAALKPWRIQMDEDYKPEVSILVPTYNESDVIYFKLENLSKLEYPPQLKQVILIDSGSSDHTMDAVNNFLKQHPDSNIQILVERERKGKCAALNLALKYCRGDVVIVSDADCFWPSNILHRVLPFLADPDVGAISGPKILLNPQQSWVTKTESEYLKSMNLVKLGESKLGSTLFFEGGFSAYKKELLESFDPYHTGSDDCGTIITMAEKKSRAIFVPEAAFFTTFPTTWKEKVSIKTRRASQLVRVFVTYISLLLRKRVLSAKKIVVQDVFLYLFSPLFFILLLATTIGLLLYFPYFALTFVILFVPRVRLTLFEVVQNYLMLFIGIFLLALNKKFIIWDRPKDRTLLTENMLRQYMLI